MTENNLNTHAKPCDGCPYRIDCPSGVWHMEEYEKLVLYDADTSCQPPQVFLCHDGDRKNTLCRGWLDCHGKDQLLSLRIAVSMGIADQGIFDMPKSSVPVFESGEAAMKHGMRDIDIPTERAQDKVDSLLKRHPELKVR